MATDRLLDYLAGTLAEAYRRELDQEENVWRSLPFFAATLALQLTVLVQLRGWLGTITGPMAWVAVSLLGGIAVATVSAIGFLTLSILPANFKHAARHSDLVDYSRQMWTDAARQPGATPDSAAEFVLSLLKTEVMRQFADAVENNRAINRRRAGRRTKAGIAMLGSVAMMLVVVTLAVLTK
jgi:hypothetical protein